MGWKIPAAFKPRRPQVMILNHHAKTQIIKNRAKASEVNNELPTKSEVIKLKTKEALKYRPCPRHGKKYLVKESGAIYCFAETPGEMFTRCFYHVAFKDDEELCKEEQLS